MCYLYGKKNSDGSDLEESDDEQSRKEGNSTKMVQLAKDVQVDLPETRGV